MIRVATGDDSGWSQAVRSVALPLVGDLVGHTLDWIRIGEEEQVLCGAAGSTFAVTDLESAWRIVEDNGWTVSCCTYLSPCLENAR